jgi:hypothetical protein
VTSVLSESSLGVALAARLPFLVLDVQAHIVTPPQAPPTPPPQPPPPPLVPPGSPPSPQPPPGLSNEASVMIIIAVTVVAVITIIIIRVVPIIARSRLRQKNMTNPTVVPHKPHRQCVMSSDASTQVSSPDDFGGGFHSRVESFSEQEVDQTMPTPVTGPELSPYLQRMRVQLSHSSASLLTKIMDGHDDTLPVWRTDETVPRTSGPDDPRETRFFGTPGADGPLTAHGRHITKNAEEKWEAFKNSQRRNPPSVSEMRQLRSAGQLARFTSRGGPVLPPARGTQGPERRPRDTPRPDRTSTPVYF